MQENKTKVGVTDNVRLYNLYRPFAFVQNFGIRQQKSFKPLL
jgi:hypothetical protein